MDIKINKRGLGLGKYVKKLSFLLIINLVILIVSFFAIKASGINFNTVGQWSKQMVYWMPYHLKSIFVDVDHVSIHIKQTDFQHLDFERQEAIASSDEWGNTYVKNFNYVPAKIEIEQNVIPVKIRLKGDRNIHYDDDSQWSFRIKSKNENTIFGMKDFSIHKPKARNYIHEWIFHEMLNRQDILSGRYFFAEVDLNGKKLGAYAFEEHFEKRLIENNHHREAPILKLEENHQWDYRLAQISPFDTKALLDSTQLKYFNKANELLDGFRKGNNSISEVFDVKKLANYFALTDLLQMPHGALWKSIRFYYNPLTSKIEPIGYDGHRSAAGNGDKFYLASEIGVDKEGGWIHDDFGNWFRMIFNSYATFDNEFISAYYSALWNYSNPIFLDDFFEEIDDELERNLSIIAKDFPILKDQMHSYGPKLATFSKTDFYNRQLKIKEKVRGLLLYCHLNENKNGKVLITVGNPESMPFEVKGLQINDKILLTEAIKTIVPQRSYEDFVKYQVLEFSSDSISQRLVKDSLSSVRLLYSLPGWGVDKATPIHSFKPAEIKIDNYDLIRMTTPLVNFPFLDINENDRVIQIKKGNWVLDKDIVFPKDYKVLADGGVEIDLIKSAGILSYSPLSFVGKSDEKIKIFSSDGSGQGIAVLNAKGASRFENVLFDNLKSINKSGWILPSAITFYESDIHVIDCEFANNESEDYFNVVRSNFKISGCKFKNVFSDAVDSDFSKGQIEKSEFINCGNDAIDISGSNVELNQILLDSIGDKGLSAGERSFLKAKNVIIRNTEIAVASKDMSELVAELVDISFSRIGYTVFQKKSEFDGAKITIIGGEMKNNEIDFMLEDNSILILNGISRIPDRVNVQELLYGIEYGKSSK